MENDGKYVEILNEIIGNENYRELVADITNKSLDKFGRDISIEELVKIIEINIKSLLIIGLSLGMNLTKEEIDEKIYSHHTEKYIVEDSFNQYIKKYSKYIKIIQNFVEEQNRKTFE